MENLHLNWLTEKHTDFEYKQYVLLGYLKNMNDEFEAQRLYPAFNQLKEQYDNLMCLKAGFNMLENKLSKAIKSIDIQNYNIVYQSICEDDKLRHELTAILDYSIPLIEQLIQKGQQILDKVEQKIAISPIGLTPLFCKEGYLFLSSPQALKTKVYSYQLSFYENSKINYRAVQTKFINDYEKSISSTYEYMKLDLIKNIKDLPNPATYLVASEMFLPLEFTFLPVATMKLSKMIN
jgi:hypothetical protein